jgi:exodeoxyribonuclease VII small subunit
MRYKFRMTKAKRPPDFEKSLAELEAIVEKLETGDLPIEESLKSFEKGIALTRDCQGALDAAQARVDILLKRDGAASLERFDADEDDEASQDD